MNKLIAIIAFLVAATFVPSALRAASPAATEEWVRQYVATNSAYLASTTTSTTSNGVINASAGEGDDKVEVRVEEFGDAALIVTNSQTAIANGTRFVWNGRGSYICPSGVIASTPTNLMWGVLGSYETNGVIRFDGAFDLRPILIQKSTSFAITNGMTFAAYEPRWFDRVAGALASLLVPTARAEIPNSPEGWYTPNAGWKKDLQSEIVIELYNAKNKEWRQVEMPMSYDSSGEPYLSNETIIAAFDSVQANVASAMYAVGAAIQGIVQIETDVVWNRAAIEKIGENLNQLVGNHDMTTKDEDGKTRTLHLNVGKDGISLSGLKKTDEYTVSNDGDTFSLYKNDSSVGDSWKAGTEPDGSSIGILQEGETKKLQLKGWNTATKDGKSLADLLKDDGEKDYFLIPHRTSGGDISYTHLGHLDIGSVKVDGHSITTNETEDSSASIKGFADADPYQIPFTDASTLEWTTGGEIIGSLLVKGSDHKPTWASIDDNGKYYGTPITGNPFVGWHSLPNVTTNYVVVDELTLTEDNEGDVKTLKMKPTEDGKLHAWGDSGWVALNIGSNLEFSVNVDGKTIVSNENNELELHGITGLTGEKRPRWNGTELVWDDLEDWVDGVSISTTDSDGSAKLSIEGWDDLNQHCDQDLSALLTDESKANERTTHFLVTKKTDTGELHYLPIGNVLQIAGVSAYTGTDASTASGSNVVFSANGNCDVTVSGSGDKVSIKIEAFFK